MEKEKIYKPEKVSLDMSIDVCIELKKIIDRLKSYGYETQAPVGAVEKAITEERSVFSPMALLMYKKHLVNFNFLHKINSKIYGINIIEDINSFKVKEKETKQEK